MRGFNQVRMFAAMYFEIFPHLRTHQSQHRREIKVPWRLFPRIFSTSPILLPQQRGANPLTINEHAVDPLHYFPVLDMFVAQFSSAWSDVFDDLACFAVD